MILSNLSNQSLKATLLVAAILPLGMLTSGCQSTPYQNNTMHQSPQPSAITRHDNKMSLVELTVPVADTGLSVDADKSHPIVELMPFIVKQADTLQLTATQKQTFADYRQAVQQQRIQLQSNEKTLRGQLRTALMQGMDDEVTSDLMRRISQTEHAHMELRKNCIETVRATLSEAQYEKLMTLYRASLR